MWYMRVSRSTKSHPIDQISRLRGWRMPGGDDFDNSNPDDEIRDLIIGIELGIRTRVEIAYLHVDVHVSCYDYLGIDQFRLQFLRK